MSVAPPDRLTDVDSRLEELTDPVSSGGWVTIVWNDPVNLMSYVAWVFRTYFGYSQAKADKLMLAVHNDGKAVVSHGGREQMEADTAAMHEYSLWATFEKTD